jgi:hypothetical protein
VSVEIEIGLRSIGVATVVIPFEHAERHQRVEEVASTAFVDSDLLRKRVQIERSLRKRSEHAKLGRTQQRLGSSERKAELHNSVGRDEGYFHELSPA